VEKRNGKRLGSEGISKKAVLIPGKAKMPTSEFFSFPLKTAI
jgi:hypothetical protein